MSDAKAMTVRLPIALAEELELVAHASNLPVAEVIRRAIVEHLTARANDEQLQERLNQLNRQLAETIRRLQPSLPEQLTDYRERMVAYRRQIG